MTVITHLHDILTFRPIKAANTSADTQCMIISDEQARAAANYLRDTHCRGAVCVAPDVSAELIQRAREVAEATPDMRSDRVVDAVERMRTHTLDSHDIAEKMLSRIMSDALR